MAALVFGIAQVRAAARDRRERLTLEALHTFQTREFAALMHHIITRKVPATNEGLRALPADDQIMFIQFAQQMESLGLLVAQELIDIDLVDKTIGSLVSVTWEKYRPMIHDSRNKRPDPFLAEYFQWLAERIDERMRNTPRKPYYLNF